MKENMTYSVIKGGIINLTRQMASYYGKYKIRINTLSPGGIEGPVAGKSKKQDKIFIKNYSSKNPMKRLPVLPLKIFNFVFTGNKLSIKFKITGIIKIFINLIVLLSSIKNI